MKHLHRVLRKRAIERDRVKNVQRERARQKRKKKYVCLCIFIFIRFPEEGGKTTSTALLVAQVERDLPVANWIQGIQSKGKLL